MGRLWARGRSNWVVFVGAGLMCRSLDLRRLCRAAGAFVEHERWWRHPQLGLVTRQADWSRGEFDITVEDNSDTLDLASDRLR